MSELILRETFEEDGLLKHVFTKAKKHEVNRPVLSPIHTSDWTAAILIGGLHANNDLTISIVKGIGYERSGKDFAQYPYISGQLSNGYKLEEFGNQVFHVGDIPGACYYYYPTLQESTAMCSKAGWLQSPNREILFIIVENAFGNVIPFWEPVSDNFYIRFIKVMFRKKFWAVSMGINWFLPTGMDLDAQSTIPTDIPNEWRQKYDEFINDAKVVNTMWIRGEFRRMWRRYRNWTLSTLKEDLSTQGTGICRDQFQVNRIVNWCKDSGNKMFPVVTNCLRSYSNFMNTYKNDIPSKFLIDNDKNILGPFTNGAYVSIIRGMSRRRYWYYALYGNMKHFMPYMFTGGAYL